MSKETEINFSLYVEEIVPKVKHVILNFRNQEPFNIVVQVSGINRFKLSLG